MAKTKYTYSTKLTKKGTFRIRHWVEYFKDEDTGELFPVKRSKPIKLNGQKIVFYPSSVIKKMKKEERERTLI